MACTQGKCSSSNDNLNSSVITEEEENFVCTTLNFIDATHHTGMADNSYTVEENGEHSRSQNFHLDSDDNAVDGWNKGVPPLPVCTSTPCTGRCQSRLLDSVALLSQEDSGLGGSLTSCCSSSSVVPPKADSPCPSTPVLSLSSSLSQTDSPAPSNLESLSPLSSSTDSPLKNAEATTPATSSLKEGRPQSLLAMGEILSTPLSLSLSALFIQHGAGALVTSTPVDGDSPVTGQALQQHRQEETPAASDAVISMTGPLFQNHRPNTDSRALCSPSPPPQFQQWNSSSQDVDSKDEAFFSSSHLLASLTFPSPAMVDEESSQRLALVQQMLRQCTPNPASRLIGRHVGVEHVDIIMELHQRNLPACGVFAWLSPYLQPADFIRMSLVCRRWRQACLEDKMGSKYRKLSMHIHNSEKENSLHFKDGSGDEVQAMTRAFTCLGKVQVTAPPSPVKHVLSSPVLYEKARKSLRWEELLRHCPLCHSVAKVAESQVRAHCLNQQCLNDFCTHCLAFYHPTQPCLSQPQALRDPPGSRKSKKQLKRISNL